MYPVSFAPYARTQSLIHGDFSLNIHHIYGIYLASSNSAKIFSPFARADSIFPTM